jgi:hypothetical protein
MPLYLVPYLTYIIGLEIWLVSLNPENWKIDGRFKGLSR